MRPKILLISSHHYEWAPDTDPITVREENFPEVRYLKNPQAEGAPPKLWVWFWQISLFKKFRLHFYFYSLTPRASPPPSLPFFFSLSFRPRLIPTSNTHVTLSESPCLSEALIPHLKTAVITAGRLTSRSPRDESIEIINGWESTLQTIQRCTNKRHYLFIYPFIFQSCTWPCAASSTKGEKQAELVTAQSLNPATSEP